MRAKPLHRRQAGLSFKRVLSTVFVIAVVGFLAMRHANFVLGRSMMLAFPLDDTTYRAAWPSLTGTVTAKDVIFPAPEGSGLKPFRFAEVKVEVPMWQYLRSAFSRRRGAMLNAIDDVRITLREGSGEYGLPFTNMLGAFGAASAAPFEAEGCADDHIWSSAELSAMGLKPGPTELVVHYRRDKGVLYLEEDLRTPGVASVSYRGRMQMNDNFSLFSLLDGGKNAVVADSWSLGDEGFNAARNRYCAEKDKVTPAQFAERHVASVQRLLAATGLAGNADLVTAYRDYATRGGKLELSIDYQPVLTAERYEDTNIGSWLPQMQGKFSLNGKPLPFGLESRAPLPLPESEDESGEMMTTLQVLRAEGTDPAQLAAADPAQSVGTAAPAAATTPVTTTMPAAATTVSATPTGKSAPNPAPTSSFLNDPDLPASASARPAPAKPPVTPAAAPAAAVASAPAAAAPAPIIASARAGADTSLPDNHIAAGTRVDYAQLGKMIGQHARVHMKTRPPMQGLIVREEKGVVYLRRHLGSGYAVLQIDKASFDYAEAM